MIFSKLPTREATFRNKIASLLTPVRVPVKGENLTLEASFYKPIGENKYFFDTKFPKERILLHFTAGSISSDIDTLTLENGNFISVPFVIARDGTIYQLFGSAAWARNIGAGLGNEKGMNNAQDKITIAIEISNFGFLIERDGNLETIYSRVKDKKTGVVSPVQIYCSLGETDAYQKIETPFREQSYFATFTDIQYESLIILLRFLTAKYNIPRAFLAEDKRFLQTSEVLNFKGIVSHVNYRKDKWDIGTAFDWNKVIAGVQATEFVPQFVNIANVRDFEPIVLTSEEALMEQLPKNPEPTKEVVKDLQDNQKATKVGKMFTLLVGINEYENFPLDGCVNDMNNVKAYLETKSGLEIKTLTLTNKEATKKAIVEGFRKHLSKASKGDTVVFYFSGHGTKEFADPLWKKDATTSGLECVVCYNGEPNFLLADKEIRFLLQELWSKTQAHIVVIADCCHSGDNTRGELLKEAFKNSKERRVRLEKVFPIRAWNDFIFSDKISFETAKNAKLVSDFLPEGNHIQLAACESDESALEVNGNGVFTTNLLKILENCGGNISYQALSGRIRNYMKVLYEQKPRIYSVGSTDQINTIFLNKGVDESGTRSEIVFNPAKGWVLNLGAMHGIKPNLEVGILDEKGKLLSEATVSEVFIDYSTVKSASVFNKANVYQATVSGALVRHLDIQLKNFDTNPNDLAKASDALLTQASGHYDFKQEGESDYTLHFKHGRAYLTKFNDDFRPLFMPIGIKTEGFDSKISQYLRDISRWHYLADLTNKNSNGVLKNPLLIEVFKVIADGTEEKLDTSGGKATLDFEKIAEKWKGSIKIKVKNQTDQKLYVCVGYMTTEFEIDTSLLPSKVQLFDPKAEIFLQFRGSDTIPMFLNPVAKEYNWEKSIEYLNFIISTEEFSDAAFVQEGLPRPAILKDKDKPKDLGARRMLGEEEDDVKISDWTTQKLTLESMNPVFDIINKEELEKLLQYDEMANFALGLYFDVTKNEKLQPIFSLKANIKVPPSERSFVRDMILELANTIEDANREWAYHQVKNERMRVVAEGDSWFLYPFKLKEIIDQLSPLYAIRSIAAAGDTLENYIKDKDKSIGYRRVIAEQNAKLFLVSGGGNDILGEEFEAFVKDNQPDGLLPNEYITQKFWDKLGDLETWYKEMFADIVGLNISMIVHGYDYIFPGNDPREMSWAGKYMKQKGITNPATQRNIIIFIMDEFNARLAEWVTSFPKVHYLDVRNSVPESEDWFDEIHPKDIGFNTIAIKFTEKINDLINSGEIVLA